MGKIVHYYFNYSANTQIFNYPFKNGKELLSEGPITKNQQVQLKPWDVKIIEEE
jgi:beta-galactosidase